MDEATPALHVMCLAETGKNAVGEPWPLYSPAAGNMAGQNLGLGYGYDEMLRYFLMHDGGMKCDEATAAVRAYWKAARGE